jgi:hypothetical protein
MASVEVSALRGEVARSGYWQELRPPTAHNGELNDLKAPLRTKLVATSMSGAK